MEITRSLTCTVCGEVDDKSICEKDLPMMANIDEVSILHYVLYFDFCFENQTVKCKSVIYISQSEMLNGFQKIILDTYKLKVKSVQMICSINEFDSASRYHDEANKKHFHRKFQELRELRKWRQCNLQFEQDTWFTKVFGWKDNDSLPSVISFEYEVCGCSPSLLWRLCHPDQDTLQQVAFTPGSQINDRGLFPCQDAPRAMASWEAFVTLNDSCSVLMSSDEDGQLVHIKSNRKTWYFYTSLIMPMSTLAIIAGHFSETIDLTSSHSERKACLPISVKAYWIESPKQQLMNSSWLDEFVQGLETILRNAERLLGELPCHRIDFIVLPNKSFQSLGLASPNMIFLASCVFNEITYCLLRIAHEIAHFWFGLCIGALNWEEEWLSEGFATYFEDAFYPTGDFPGKCLMLLLSLQNEVKSTSKELLRLRNERLSDHDQHSGIINGLVPVKKFLCVHYLKGYFLLMYLSSFVGSDNFMSFLKTFASNFKNKLISSLNFLQEFELFLPSEISDGFSIHDIKNQWLDSVDLPSFMGKRFLSTLKLDERMFSMLPKTCSVVLTKVKECFNHLKLIRKDEFKKSLSLLSSNEVLLLLERTLIISKKDRKVYRLIRDTLSKADHPEIQHRLCELVIKYEDTSFIRYLENFLEQNSALGVYLYGELIISKKPEFNHLARHLYGKNQAFFEPQTVQVLREMLLMD